jgi:Zn-dependent protease
MRYTLGAGTYFGIPVKIHFTFPLILIVFGAEAWARGTWADGLRAVATIAVVFVCVVLHEFGHSLQVKRYGIRVRDIVLLPIGGMARAERIPENPWQEIVVAISGPLVNFALAAIFALVLWVTGGSFMPGDGFLADLLAINLVLGTFNLIPAFPMDGGRILRGLLATRLSYLRATRYARGVGQVIALVFVVAGFLNSAFLMLPVIAVFIFFGAMSEENLIRTRVTLEGRQLGDFVEPAPVMNLSDTIGTVADTTVGKAAAVAVTDDSHATIGVVTGADLMFALGEGRTGDAVSSIARYDFPVLRSDMPAIQAYYFLKAERASYAGVVRDGRFLGLVHFERFEQAVPAASNYA